MSETLIYRYRKTRGQAARKFFAMAAMCVVYIAAMFGFEQWAGTLIQSDFRAAGLIGFTLAAVVLSGVGLWHLTHPAVFEAVVTQTRLRITYPDSKQWSFDVAIADIERFENRGTLSHAGRGIPDHGVLMKNGTFHHVSMNYGLSINRLFEEVQKCSPGLTYPKALNVKVEGPLARDYRD